MVPVATLERAVDEELQLAGCFSSSGTLQVLWVAVSPSWRPVGSGLEALGYALPQELLVAGPGLLTGDVQVLLPQPTVSQDSSWIS